MSTREWVEGPALEEYLPHRGINMLIDGFTAGSEEEQTEGETRLSVLSDDPVGRNIFLRKGDGGEVVIEPALAEYLALGAICLMSADMADGEIAFFSVISKYESVREAIAGEVLTGTVKRLRDKARFRRFEGAVNAANGDEVANANIMAYAAEAGGSSEKRESTRLLKPPVVGETKPVDRGTFAWKRPEMVFVDELVDSEGDLSGGTFRYTYPADHPFCPGHFPNNPVMMGIAQWIAAADAAACLVVEQARAGMSGSPNGLWQVDADIIRESGSPVTEIKQMTIAASCDNDVLSPVRILKTKRVGFRDQVRPGETIFVRAKVAPAD